MSEDNNNNWELESGENRKGTERGGARGKVGSNPVEGTSQNVENQVAVSGGGVSCLCGTSSANKNESAHNLCWEGFKALYRKCLPIRSTDYGDSYEVNIPVCAVLFISLILLVSLLPPSFHYIQYDQYGLLRNKYGDVHLTPTYDQGRYFEPLSFSFEVFPSTYQPVEMTTAVFLDNGMEFDLTVRFYYSIPKDYVGALYDVYSTSYDSRIEGNAKNTLKNTASTFQLDDYLLNRSVVEKLIAANISVSVHEAVGVNVPVEYCRILNIDFPSILISTSLDSAITLQTNEINLIQQRVQLVQATTDQMVAEIESERALLLENADNKVIQLVDTATAQASSITNTARSEGIGGLFAALNITDSASKDSLLKAMAIYDNAHTDSTVMYEVLAGSLVNV